MNLDRMGVPKEVLGEGSFGVVGLGSYTGSTKDGSVVNIPVAIKTALSNVLVAAKEDSTRVRSFLTEVKLICALDHPNICDCYGALTREGDVSAFSLSRYPPVLGVDHPTHPTDGPKWDLIGGTHTR
jgi:serine/threonine protein kinase